MRKAGFPFGIEVKFPITHYFCLSDQKGGQRSTNLKMLGVCLELFSGGDIDCMLRVYQKKHKKPPLPNTHDQALAAQKLQQVISRIQSLHATEAKAYTKTDLVSVISCCHSREDVKIDFEWEIPQKQWTRSRIDLQKKSQQPNPPSNHKIRSEKTRKAVAAFYVEKSQPAANQTCYDKSTKAHISVHTRTISKKQLHEEFVRTCDVEDRVSYCTFAKLQPVHVRLGKRKTDLCSLCENGKELEAQLNKKRKKSLSLSETEATEVKENEEIFQVHRHAKDEQNAAFQRKLDTLEAGEAVIVMDFKENLRINKGPKETGSNFFHSTQVTVLGSVVYVRGNDGKTKKQHINILSYDLSHDSHFVCSALPLILEDMKQLSATQIKNLHFWFDCGPHFRSKELLHKLLVDVPQRYDCDICVNFFVEGHGKSPCDAHFSHISRAVKSYSLRTDISSIEHVDLAIQNHFREIICACLMPQVCRATKIEKSSYRTFSGEKEGQNTRFLCLLCRFEKNFCVCSEWHEQICLHPDR